MKKWNELPPEIQEKMLERQFEQTGKRDASVFCCETSAGAFQNGFTWDSTIEGDDFWDDIILGGDFNIFYEKYPKPTKKPTPKQLADKIIKEMQDYGLTPEQMINVIQLAKIRYESLCITTKK